MRQQQYYGKRTMIKLSRLDIVRNLWFVVNELIYKLQAPFFLSLLCPACLARLDGSANGTNSSVITAGLWDSLSGVPFQPNWNKPGFPVFGTTRREDYGGEPSFYREA